MGLFDSIGEAIGIGADTVSGGVGSLFGAGMGLIGANQQQNANTAYLNQANAFSAAQSDKQMQFQKDMRATQYQTTVDDLAKAGLNPMLAYTNGGSGNLSGSSASSISPQPAVNKLSGIVSNATSGGQMAAAIKQTHLNNVQTIAQITDTEKSAQLKDAQTALAVEQIPVSQAIVKEKDATVKSLLNGIRLQNSSIGLNAARTAKTNQDWRIDEPAAWSQDTYGKPKRVVQDVATTATSALGAKNAIKGKTVNINNPTYQRTQYLERD